MLMSTKNESLNPIQKYFTVFLKIISQFWLVFIVIIIYFESHRVANFANNNS